VGDNSPGRVYDLIYVGKVKPAHVYEALYLIVIRLGRVQVRKQVFKRS
jgi:hypothetical protein